MALIVCTECGKSFSDKARQCPECGCPTEFSLTNSKAMPVQHSFRNNVKQPPHIQYDLPPIIRYNLIEKIVSQIRVIRSKYQDKVRQVPTFRIDDWTFSYTDADRLFLFLYQTFHKETDKLIKQYKESFLLEVKAVSIHEIKALEELLNKCEMLKIRNRIDLMSGKADAIQDDVDPGPFAQGFMNKIYKRREDVREEKGKDYVLAIDIEQKMEEAIECAGQKILKTLETDYSIAPDVESHIRIIMFYIKEIYNDYIDYIKNNIDDSLEEFIDLYYSNVYFGFIYHIQEKYGALSGFGFEEYTKFYSKEEDDLIVRTKTEIAWRKAYLKDPEKYKLWEKLAEDVDHIILFLIQSMNEKCQLGINPQYYDFSTYKKQQKRLSSIESIQNEDEKKALVKKIFLRFPFNSDVYPYLLDVYGDQNGEVSRLLNEFHVDVEAIRKALFEGYVNSAYAKTDWRKVDTIVEAYKIINAKKEFLQYTGKTSDKYKKICAEYNMYDQWRQLLESKPDLGIQGICNLFESQMDIPNDAGSEKLKKGLNISDGTIIYFAHDDSIFKNGKNGFAITNKGFFVRQMFKKAVFYSNESLISDSHTYKISRGEGIFVDDKLLLYFTGSDEAANKLYIAIQYMMPLLTLSAQEKDDNQDKFCVFCGGKIKITSNFCQYCGGENTYKVN